MERPCSAEQSRKAKPGQVFRSFAPAKQHRLASRVLWITDKETQRLGRTVAAVSACFMRLSLLVSRLKNHCNPRILGTLRDTTPSHSQNTMTMTAMDFILSLYVNLQRCSKVHASELRSVRLIKT